MKIIVAYSKNRAIGKDNKLLWHLADDMAFFKKMTLGKIVIMGKNTYLSLPERFRPLPKRINIVISRGKPIEEKENLIWVHSIEQALNYCKKIGMDDVFIIGGGKIYQSFMQYADTIYATEVEAIIDGDTFFPELEDEWRKEIMENHKKNDENDYNFQIIAYSKVKN